MRRPAKGCGEPSEASVVKSNVFFCVALLIGIAPSPAYAGYVVLDAFTSGSSGANSFAPLIADQAGNLYGTTSSGGNGGCVRFASTGCGTVFESSPPSAPNGSWTEKVLYRFPGGNGPSMPVAGLSMDGAGDLFGM